MTDRTKTSTDQSSSQAIAGQSPSDDAASRLPLSPEVHEQLCRLRSGDPVKVRETLLAAFRKSDNDGFDFLVAACIVVPDVPMCERLMWVLAELRRYAPFWAAVSLAYFEIVRGTPSAQIRRMAAAGIGELICCDITRDDLSPPAYNAAVRKRICKRIVEATTGSQTTEAKPPSLRRNSPTHGTGQAARSQARARAKRRRELRLIQPRSKQFQPTWQSFRRDRRMAFFRWRPNG